MDPHCPECYPKSENESISQNSPLSCRSKNKSSWESVQTVNAQSAHINLNGLQITTKMRLCFSLSGYLYRSIKEQFSVLMHISISETLKNIFKDVLQFIKARKYFRFYITKGTFSFSLSLTGLCDDRSYHNYPGPFIYPNVNGFFLHRFWQTKTMKI